MSTKSIILSSSGLKNIITGFQEKEESFRFIIGREEIKIPRIFAEFISPRVSHIHQSDPTIDHLDFNEYLSKIKTKTETFDNILTEDTKASIHRMIRGESIDINERNEANLLRFSVLLSNKELFNLIGINHKEEKTIEERIEEVHLYTEIAGDTFSLESTSMIDDIASKIKLKELSQMKKIPRKIFYSIIRNEHFKADDEDDLMDIINKLVSENKSEEEVTNIDLYETVDLKKLSEEKFREFLSTFDYTEMTAAIWRSLCECFFTKRTKKNELELVYDGDTSYRFSGIINYLRGNRKINISDEGIVSVTASSTECSHDAKYAVDFDSEEFFHSDSSGDWLRIDFKDKKIRPTHYSIKTPSNHGDDQFPVNWCIEVSNTGNENDWRTIDTRNNVTSISKRNQSDTFDIGTRLSSNESFRFVRLRSTGNTSGGSSNIAFSSLEFFGTLIK